MKNNQKGFITSLLVIVIIVVEVGLYFYFRKDTSPQQPSNASLTEVSNGISCTYNDKYFVASKNLVGEPGSDILVKSKTSKDQVIPCEYSVGEKDFELKGVSAEYFLALTNNFLVLDAGTGSDPRQLIVYNLNSRQIFYQDSYSGFEQVQGDTITYWNPTDEKVTSTNCSQLNEYSSEGLGAGIESLVSLDLTTLKKTGLNQYRCKPRQ